MGTENQHPVKKPQSIQYYIIVAVIIIATIIAFTIKYGNNTPGKTNANANGKTEYKVVDYDLKLSNSMGMTSAECYIAVKNTGTTNLFLDEMSIDIETLTGELVAVVDNVYGYPQIIAPGETGYYYANEHVSNIDINKGYKMEYKTNAQKSKKPLVRLPVSDGNIVKDNFWEVNAVGRVTNNTSSKISIYYVTILLLDEKGCLIGCEYDIVYDDIMPGASQSFDTNFVYFEGKYEDVDEFRIYAYPYYYYNN